MFKKKPNIKPLSPLKSSDRRRTADQVIADFGLQVPEEGPTALRKALLPENSLSARFTTTAGPDLKQVSGTIYAGNHEGTGDELRILWVKVEDKMFPTVYTLWHNPGLVPLLHTPGFVVEKLQGGADLMTPGLQRGPPFPAKATKGAVVAIASLEAPTVPMAVGTCEIDVASLQEVRGAKGHAVQTFHWSGDELWAWSTTGKPGLEPPASLEGWIDESEGATDLVDGMDRLDLECSHDGGVTLDFASTDIPAAAEKVEGEASRKTNDLVEEVEEPELTTKEIDEAFTNAFLYGVKHHMELNKDHPTYGLDFPLTQSNVMSLLVQPFLPTYTPARTASLQIKKTSWKNAKKFIKHLDKEQIVKSKDRGGSEVVILDIDFNDRQIQSFVPYRLPKKESATTTDAKASSASSSAEADVGQKLQIISLWRPKEKLAFIFNASQADPRGYYSKNELRQLLSRYAEKENLVSPKNKRMIKINPQLVDALLTSSAADDRALAAGEIPIDALAERMQAASSPFHAILRNDASIADAKPKAGLPPKIHIVLETRSGNKTVTKVSGMEAFHVSPQPLADELRKTCAGSTSVERLQGSSPKNPVMEVMVQGPQKDAVVKALGKRGVEPKWIETVDKTKGKKKGWIPVGDSRFGRRGDVWQRMLDASGTLRFRKWRERRAYRVQVFEKIWGRVYRCPTYRRGRRLGSVGLEGKGQRDAPR